MYNGKLLRKFTPIINVKLVRAILNNDAFVTKASIR